MSLIEISSHERAVFGHRVIEISSHERAVFGHAIWHVALMILLVYCVYVVCANHVYLTLTLLLM